MGQAKLAQMGQFYVAVYTTSSSGVSGGASGAHIVLVCVFVSGPSDRLSVSGPFDRISIT